MAQRVVKLKPDKPAPGPAIRIRRADSGFGFCVGGIDEKGFEDFRGISEHSDYDVALKEAENRAYRTRLPVVNATGIPELETKAAEQHSRKAAQATVVPSAPISKPDRNIEKSLERDLPEALSGWFGLPDVSDCFDDGLIEDIGKRSNLLYRYLREVSRNNYADQFGASNDHPVAFTQKSHDLIQWQFANVFHHMVAIQATTWAHLKAAHDRIADLEHKCLTVDSFAAQVADDDRTIELSFGTGEQRQVASFKWPTPIYRGTYESGQHYDAGDMVTHQGSCWIAQRAASAKPDAPNSGFKLAVKRGRDGKP